MTNLVTFISIHTLRVEGDAIDKFNEELNTISIHTLRVEGDTSFGPALA